MRYLKAQIELQFGKRIKYSKDCHVLSDDIYKTCGERLSPTTLKRIFGMAAMNTTPRKFTLDVLKQYSLSKDNNAISNQGEIASLSNYHFSDIVYSSQIQINTELNFLFTGNTVLGVKYVGSMIYEVIFAGNTIFEVGDKVKAVALIKGQMFEVIEVLRKDNPDVMLINQISGLGVVQLIEVVAP